VTRKTSEKYKKHDNWDEEGTMKKTRDSDGGRWDGGGERGWPTATSDIVIADAPDITHFLVLILFIISRLACSSVGCFLGREPLHIF